VSSPRFGVDLGGTKVLGVAVDDGSGAVLATHRASTPVGGPEIVDTLHEVVAALAEATDQAPASVGIGAAGLVDRAGVLRFGPNLPGVIDLDLVGQLRARVGVDVVVDNDVTCAAVAEHRIGAARDVSDAVVVALGTGIGGALILDGAVRRGAHHMAGEFGHLLVDPDGPLCGCGQRGCWEQFASGSALGRLARDRAIGGLLPGVVAAAGGSPELVDAVHLTAAAAGRDPDAVAVLDEFARWVAVGLAGLVNVADPEIIVIGGGIVSTGDLLLDPVRANLAHLTVGAGHRPEVPVVGATAGPMAAAIGAALLPVVTPHRALETESGLSGHQE
jgi:glucokinase